MSKTNIFSYDINLCFSDDKDVLYHVYTLSVLYEKNYYEIICHTKTIIVMKLCTCKEKKTSLA